MGQPTTAIRLNSTVPLAPTGNQNVKFVSDNGDPQQQITAYPQQATTSLLGVMKPDGTTITIDPTTGVISSTGGGAGTTHFEPLIDGLEAIIFNGTGDIIMVGGVINT